VINKEARTIFAKIKKTLLYSGYEVILSGKLNVSTGEHVRFREAKGYIVPDELRIYINKAIGINDRVITLVHELLHEIYPVWQEARVESQSKQIFKNLTVPELGFLQFFVMTKTELNSALKSHQAHSPLC
jgi:hypothetical protein